MWRKTPTFGCPTISKALTEALVPQSETGVLFRECRTDDKDDISKARSACGDSAADFEIGSADSFRGGSVIEISWQKKTMGEYHLFYAEDFERKTWLAADTACSVTITEVPAWIYFGEQWVYHSFEKTKERVISKENINLIRCANFCRCWTKQIEFNSQGPIGGRVLDSGSLVGKLTKVRYQSLLSVVRAW